MHHYVQNNAVLNTATTPQYSASCCCCTNQDKLNSEYKKACRLHKPQALSIDITNNLLSNTFLMRKFHIMRTFISPTDKDLLVKYYSNLIFGFSMLIISMVLSNTIIASPSLTSPVSHTAAANIGDDYFTIEKVGERYYQISYKSGNDILIFRPDRIEFNKLVSSDQISFLLFDSNATLRGEGLDLISSEVIKNPNKAMASALGAEDMTVEKYRQIVYKNFRSGENLLISLRDGELVLELESENKNNTPLSFRYSGPVNSDKSVSMQKPLKGSSLTLSNVKKNVESGQLEVPFIQSKEEFSISIIL